MALGRVVVAWAAVAAWLLVWLAAERRVVRSRIRPPRREGWWVVGEALLLTLLGALWFGSLGAGVSWLVFLLVGGLMAWPVRSAMSAARVARILVAGLVLSRLLAP